MLGNLECWFRVISMEVHGDGDEVVVVLWLHGEDDVYDDDS